MGPILVHTQGSKQPAQVRLELVKAALNQPAKSLQFDRGSIVIPADLDNAFGRALMTLMGFYSKKSQLMHGEHALFKCFEMDKMHETGPTSDVLGIAALLLVSLCLSAPQAS